jgi:hypothetical protein
MPYDCDDIRFILNSDDERSVDEEQFSRHLEGCRQCAVLCDPGSDIEGMLNAAFASAAPGGSYDEIMDRLPVVEPGNRLVLWLENHAAYIAAGMISAAIAVLILKWSYFVSVFSGIDIGGIAGSAVELAGRFRPYELNLAAFSAYLQKTPIIFFTLVSAAMVVWIFSIFEIEKSLK